MLRPESLVNSHSGSTNLLIQRNENNAAKFHRTYEVDALSLRTEELLLQNFGVAKLLSDTLPEVEDPSES